MPAIRLIASLKYDENISYKLATMNRLGVTAFRINFGRGNLEDNFKLIEILKTEFPQSVITIDLPGNKPRLNKIKSKKLFVNRNEQFRIYFGNFTENNLISIEKNKTNCSFDYDDLVHFGDNDLRARVVNVNEKFIDLAAETDGVINSRSGIIVPKKYKSVNYVDEVEKEILHRLKNSVNLVFISFADTCERVVECKKILPDVSMIAKIETTIAVSNIQDIVSISDGAMLARGDLSNFYSHADINGAVFENLSKYCKTLGKKLLVATDYFKSISDNGVFSQEERATLRSTLHFKPDFVVANETYFSPFWERICYDALEVIGEFSS